MIKIVFCIMAGLVSSAALHAQYVPFTAKAQKTEEVFVRGTKAETHTSEGSFYRRSNGSTLEEWTKLDGVEAKGVGNLHDADSGVLYQLSMGAHTAVARHTMKPMPASLTPSPNDAAPIMLAGVPCVPGRTKLHHQGKPEVWVGQSCVSLEYNILLRLEDTYTAPDGKVYHTVYEVTEIHLFAEPDPKLFDLQARNFRILN